MARLKARGPIGPSRRAREISRKLPGYLIRSLSEWHSLVSKGMHGEWKRMKENEDWQVVVSRTKTAEKLKSERKKRGLTQKEFADLLGIVPRCLRRYESGERDLPLSARIKGIVRIGVDFSPSNSLFKIAELSVSEDLEGKVVQSRRVGSRRLNMRAEVHAFRQSNFSWVAQSLMHWRDLAVLLIISYAVGTCLSIKFPLFHAGGSYVASEIDLYLFLSFPFLAVTMLYELPLLKMAVRCFERWRLRTF